MYTVPDAGASMGMCTNSDISQPLQAQHVHVYMHIFAALLLPLRESTSRLLLLLLLLPLRSLILGSPAGKVYSKLRSVCSRLNDS